jgi:hypothetical protein
VKKFVDRNFSLVLDEANSGSMGDADTVARGCQHVTWPLDFGSPLYLSSALAMKDWLGGL